MDCDVCMYDLLRDEFPKIDERIIKATVLEHGDDVKSAFKFLRSIAADDDSDDEGDASLAVNEETECCRSSTTAVQQNSSTTGSCKNSATLLQEDAFSEPNTVTDAPELANSISQISLTSFEEIVEEARKDKEVVTNLVEEVSNLRGQADQAKAAALRAKNEAATIGEDLLRKADELHRKRNQKKQDNLLRMGEIYGEKAVLATEARGLKLQLEQVNLQKERAVTVLNEIKIKLQDLCKEALEERLIAEEDGRGKEKLAQDILTTEEALMAEIEEESRKLDDEAEACLKLKEFLSHHESIIDSIQGEMCLLCEDVESFKRQVDGGMWSSVSTESLPANVNPEGPYIFRKYKSSSMSSSQESGQSFEALYNSKQICSVLSTPLSQGIVDSTGKLSNGLSQVDDGNVQQRSASEPSDVSDRECMRSGYICASMNTPLHSTLVYDSDYDSIVSVKTDEKQNRFMGDIMHGDTHSGEGKKVKSGNPSEDADTGHFWGIRSPVDSLGMSPKASPSGSHSHRSWACSEPNDTCGEPATHDRFKDSTSDGHYIPFPSAPNAAGEWVCTPAQMEDSMSSTSSSLIKVDAEDYDFL